MPDTSTNNKRIAKNTLFLYFRMLFIMAISLYTSRVVLNVLSIEDFGIYNVVGGIVGMFSFINGAMTAGTQRYLNFAIGIDDFTQTKKVFNTCINIHSIFAGFIILLAETIGLWFFYTQMNIPDSRMTAAFWVYQCSIATTCIMVISVPYNAIIIAHERMNVFAYISIVEVVCKLAIVFLLLAGNADRLILYAFLMLCVQIGIRFLYGIYCKKNFPETRFLFIKDFKLIKDMLGFTGWNLWGGCAHIAFTQGVNILLNIFFGPSVNAARGVAIQVQNAISQFATNFQTALNPQIIKSYARQDYSYMYNLVYRSSKFSFFLLFLLSLPILLETNTMLIIWLGNVPEYTVQFIRLILWIAIIDAISNPLMTSATATGKVKVYQSICGGILLMIVPVSYIVLKLGASPSAVFIVHLIIGVVTFMARLYIVHKLIGLPIKGYLHVVVQSIAFVGATAAIIPIAVKILLGYDSLLNTVIVCITALFSSFLSIYLIGLNNNEKKFICEKVNRLYTQLRKNDNDK